MKKSNWYVKWHRYPRHAYWHWAILLFVIIVAAVVLSCYSYSYAALSLPALPRNPNQLPPSLEGEKAQIDQQVNQYNALVQQAKALAEDGIACEKSCPCNAGTCQDEATVLTHNQCIARCDATIPQFKVMVSQIKSLETSISQRANAFKQKLASLKPSDLVPLPSAVACGSDGKTACTEEEARDYLLKNKEVSINKEPCTATKKSNCTSVSNMRPETLDQIAQLQKQCNCDVRITGGTETTAGVHQPGTFSHANGYKYDMSNDEKTHSALNKYIVGNCTAENNCKADYRDKAKTQKRYTYDLGYEKVEYVNEGTAKLGSHWDVSVLPKPATAVKTPVKAPVKK